MKVNRGYLSYLLGNVNENTILNAIDKNVSELWTDEIINGAIELYKKSQYEEVGTCPFCHKRTMKLIGFDLDGAGIPIEFTKSYECVYKPCKEYKSDAWVWRY